VAAAAIVGGLAFGAFGGEYRSIDYWRLKRDVRRLESDIAGYRVQGTGYSRVGWGTRDLAE
jgi:hypothetical protein